MRRLYYTAKPFMPRGAQIFLRRARVRILQPFYRSVWPIDEKAGAAPASWEGWPEGTQFALVLTHDVETEKGQERCAGLKRLEEEYGFRSSFNFVPERYQVSGALRADLQASGFEVGVHGLLHDGRLFESLEIFSERSKRINAYLRAWEAVGFRSPSMIRNLDWIHQLEIEYDASTFDTDPFEPQPEGSGTIFPFWVPGPGGGGYVELPCTLAQDFTLFVMMGERDTSIWERKLEWLAEKGGMALINTHPDYMNFGTGRATREEYPARLYEDFLHFAKSRFGDVTWAALPRDVARFWRKRAGGPAEKPGPSGSAR